MRLLGFDITRNKVNVKAETTAVLSDYVALTDLFGIQPDTIRKAGTDVAIKTSIVYACARLICGAISQLPFQIRLERERTHPQLERLLNLEPHALFSGAAFLEYMVLSVLFHGDAFIAIMRSKNGVPLSFVPLKPTEVGIIRKDGRLYYTGWIDNVNYTIDQDDMIHVPNFGFNGVRSPSVLEAGAAHALGLHISMEEFSNDFFEKGALQRHVIMKEGNWTEEQKESIRTQWEQRYAKGTRAKNLPMVFDRTVDLKQLTINSSDAQLLESRQFQITDIARAFGLPSFMINQEQKTTSWGSGVSEIGQVFLRYTLMAHINRITAEFNRKLFKRRQDRLSMDFSSLVKATMKDRYQSYAMALGGSSKPGWQTVNEIRLIEGLDKVDGEEYDKPFVPSGDVTSETEEEDDDDQNDIL